jgi:hypothetical protein
MERRNKQGIIEEKLRNERSKEAALRMVKYVGKDKKRLNELLKCFYSNDKRLAELAAWSLGDHLVKHPDMLKPHVKKFLKMLGEKGHHGSVHRCILRAFMDAEIPRIYLGKLYDRCLSLMIDQTNDVAVRAFSVKTAVHICKKHPDLKAELFIVINEMKEFDTKPAMHSTFRYAFRELK